MKYKSMEELLMAASTMPKCRIALVGPYQKLTWMSLAQVEDLKIEFICIGEEDKMIGFPKLKWASIKTVDDEDEAINTAIELIYNGQADILMNGLANPKKIFELIMKAEKMNERKPILSHIGLFEIPTYSKKMLFITDAGANITPDLVTKVEITRNVVNLAHILGYENPNVAIITPIEQVNPKNLPSTVDAAAISQMGKTGQLGKCTVDGPLALDNAISERAAKIKDIKSPVAGNADILVVHDIESGNILYKILTQLTESKVAATVAGVFYPIAMPSRTDSLANRIHSMALAKVLSLSEM